MDFVNKNGVINEKKLLAQINFSQKKVVDRSISSPTAPSILPCASLSVGVASSSLLLSDWEDVKLKSFNFWVLIKLLQLYGLRISEVLALSPSDIISKNTIIIKGLKHSKDRIINVSFADDFFLKCKNNSVYPFAGWSRFFVYREFKKLGIIYKSELSSKYSITHAYRHLVIKELSDNNINLQSMADFIGHKNEKNTKKYTK
jgi:integrase